MSNESTPYKYQYIIDQSPTLKVTREAITNKETLANQLRTMADALEKCEACEWDYKCQPPERLHAEGSNAPYYAPVEPTIETAGQWLLFMGLENILEDSHARAIARSKKHDETCRSTNLEKFDDETFCQLQSVGVVRDTIKELDAMINDCLKQFTRPDLSMQEKMELCTRMSQLSERKESLKRK